MSIHDIRNAFNRVLEGQLRCDRALMVYTDEHGRQGGKRDHQLLVFACSDGKKHEVLVKMGQDVNVAAAQFAQTLKVDNA